MADTPKTWTLLDSMRACLAEIKTANGYATNAGDYVTREPGQIPDTEPALIALVLESLQRATDPAYSAGSIGRLARVVVIGKVPTSQDNAQEKVHALLADIERCFSGKRSTFPVGITWPQFVEAKPIPPAEGVSWIGVEARFESHVRLR